MNIAVVPGYGDRSDYLRPAIRYWEKRYGSSVEIVTFGWSGEGESYDEKWQGFSETIAGMGQVAIVGISAGFSVALRALQERPDHVTHAISICGPVDIEKMNRTNLHRNYPVLERSLDQISTRDLPSERIMTLRPIRDEVVPLDAMYVEGATDVRIKMVGHAASIAWGVYRHGSDIHKFIEA